jgi:hypothetical protein
VIVVLGIIQRKGHNLADVPKISVDAADLNERGDFSP